MNIIISSDHHQILKDKDRRIAYLQSVIKQSERYTRLSCKKEKEELAALLKEQATST